MKQKAALILFSFTNSYTNSSTTNNILDLLSRTFPFEWEIVDADFNSKDFYSHPRKQYHSTKILEQALEKYSDNFEKILVLTDYDLFVPVLTFVFGEAQLKGKAAIVSTFRLHQEFYGLLYNEKLFFEILQKEILHELGHTFGLIHCKDWFCVMHASSNIDEIDIKSDHFCYLCEKFIVD